MRRARIDPADANFEILRPPLPCHRPRKAGDLVISEFEIFLYEHNFCRGVLDPRFRGDDTWGVFHRHSKSPSVGASALVAHKQKRCGVQ